MAALSGPDLYPDACVYWIGGAWQIAKYQGSPVHLPAPAAGLAVGGMQAVGGPPAVAGGQEGGRRGPDCDKVMDTGLQEQALLAAAAAVPVAMLRLGVVLATGPA